MKFRVSALRSIRDNSTVCIDTYRYVDVYTHSYGHTYVYVFEQRVYRDFFPLDVRISSSVSSLACFPGNLTETVTLFLGNVAYDKNDSDW